jgi:hypothetical protein
MTEDLPELSTIRHPKHPPRCFRQGLAQPSRDARSASRGTTNRHAPSSQLSASAIVPRAGLLWESPDDTAMRAWNNRDDATRDAALYRLHSGGREGIGPSCDFPCGDAIRRRLLRRATGAADLEEAIRLEVSGVDHGDLLSVRRRLREKEEQALRGDSPLPAYASVVGFREKKILVSPVGRT